MIRAKRAGLVPAVAPILDERVAAAGFHLAPDVIEAALRLVNEA